MCPSIISHPHKGKVEGWCVGPNVHWMGAAVWGHACMHALEEWGQVCVLGAWGEWELRGGKGSNLWHPTCLCCGWGWWPWVKGQGHTVHLTLFSTCYFVCSNNTTQKVIIVDCWGRFLFYLMCMVYDWRCHL